MVTDFLLGKFKDFALSSLFSREAKGQPSTDKSGFDLPNLVKNNQTWLALGTALLAGYTDGDDGIIGAGLKGIFDFSAAHDIADGKSNFLSEIYMSYRVGSIISEQTDSTIAGLIAAAAAYYAIDKWEDSQAPKKGLLAPALG